MTALLKGYQKTWATRARCTDTQRTPLFRADLESLLRHTSTCLQGAELAETQFAFLLAYYFMLRPSELTGIQAQHLSFSNDTHWLRIPSSKTDQLCQGQFAYCPAAEVLHPRLTELLSFARELPHERRIFRVSNQAHWGRHIRSQFDAPLIGMHSFRHGRATDLFHTLNLPVEEIQKRGRWAGRQITLYYIHNRRTSVTVTPTALPSSRIRSHNPAVSSTARIRKTS